MKKSNWQPSIDEFDSYADNSIVGFIDRLAVTPGNTQLPLSSSLIPLFEG